MHASTLAELAAAFGCASRERQILFERIARIYRIAAATRHLGRFVVFGSSASNLVPGSGASHIYVVGGVSVAPVLKQFAADGGSAVVGVTFAYPGSSWIATSNDPWVTVTGQSGPSGSGNVSYSVAPNSSGIARTGTLTVAAQTVTIHQDASIAPTASDDTLTTAEDTQTSGTLNATDPNSDPLTFSIVTNGTLGVATIINPSTGAFTYTPAANVYGSDAFTFKANDGTTDSNVATVSITVSPVNDAPVASNGTLTTSQGTAASGTLAAADVDSLALGFALVSNGAKGTVIITNATTGAFTYTPTAGASGADSFSFSATDGTLNSNTATIVVTIVPSALTVTVVSPNGGEKLFANVPTTIHWTATGAISFDVALSRNGGVTYVAIAGCTGVSGSATSCAWTPTGPATTTALVRVTARSGTTTAVDASNAVFSIATASPSITVTSPNTAVAWAIGSARVITWNHNLGANSFVRIELTRNGGASWEIVASSFQNSTATSGTLSWMVSGPTTSNAVVRISWTDGATSDTGNSSFSIGAPAIAVTTPDTNVSWKTGSIKSIRWTHNLGTAERVRIELSRDGGASWVSLASALENSSATSGTFDWAVTGPVTAAARIRVSWTRNGAVQDMSGVNFRIQ